MAKQTKSDLFWETMNPKFKCKLMQIGDEIHLSYYQDLELSRIGENLRDARIFHERCRRVLNKTEHQETNSEFDNDLLASFESLRDFFLSIAHPNERDCITQAARNFSLQFLHERGLRAKIVWHILVLRKLLPLCLESGAKKYPDTLRHRTWDGLIESAEAELDAELRNDRPPSPEEDECPAF